MATTEKSLHRDLKTLAIFIDMYCQHHHPDAPKAALDLKTHNVKEIVRKELLLCEECRKLLAHAWVKRTACPMEPKPACKHCPKHCYHPKYRQQIREVMKSSGKRIVLSGRLDYLYHLLF